MRYTEYYNQPAPELGDLADITVVTDALLAGEKNQSGKIEFLKATISGNVISLTSTSRINKYTKHYDGMTISFMSPSDIKASDTSHTLKIDELAAQPFKIKTDIKRNDIVIASFNNTDGFITTNAPIPRSSATNSNSEVTVATSKAVNDLRALVLDKQIVAGNGLTGGGNLNSNVTINVVSADDSIVVSTDNIKVNTYNGVDNTSATRPASANAVKTAYDTAHQAQETANNKLDAGAVSAEYNTGKKIEDKIKSIQITTDNKLDKGAYTGNAQSLKDEIDKKQNKQDITLETTAKEIVPAINEVNRKVKEIPIGDYLEKGQVSQEFNTAEKIEVLLKGNSGINQVEYIQDAGKKQKGKGYFDKVTGKIYEAKVTNNNTQVSNNFVAIDNVSLGNALLVSYDDVGITIETGSTIKFRFYRNGMLKTLVNIDAIVHGFYGGIETFKNVIPKQYRPVVDSIFSIGEKDLLNLILRSNGDLEIKKHTNQQNQRLMVNITYI